MKVFLLCVLQITYILNFILHILNRNSNFLNIIFKFIPFFEAIIFLNIEIIIYNANKTLIWISFIRPVSIMINFLNISLISLQKISSCNNFSYFKRFCKGILLLYCCAINLIALQNFNSLYESFPFVIELVFLGSSFFLFYFIIDKIIQEIIKLETQNKALRQHFKFLNQGLIIVEFTENQYVLEFFNEKAVLLLDNMLNVKEISNFSIRI